MRTRRSRVIAFPLAGLIASLVVAVLLPIVSSAPAAAATATVSVILDPSSIAANGPASSNPTVSTSTATATLVDSTGAPVSGVTVTWSTNGDVTFFPSSCSTGPNGQCQVFVQASGTADNETITATTSDGKTGTATLHEYVPVTTVTVTRNAVSVPADGKSVVTVKAHVSGASNAPSTQAVVTWKTDGDMTFPKGTSCTTDNNGDCSVPVQASTTADTETITATSDGVSGTTSITENPLGTLLVSVSPYAIASNGTATVTATLAGVGAGVTINFLSDDGGDTFLPTNSCITLSNGGCTVQVTGSGTPHIVTITATSSSPAATGTTPLDQYGPIATVTVLPARQTVAPDGISTRDVTAFITDAQGDPVGGAGVLFGTNGDMTFPNGNGCTTDSSAPATAGLCSVKVQASTTPDTETITASSGGHSGTGTIVEAAKLALSLTPASIAANGTDTSTATATLTDANGAGLSGQSIVFTKSGDVTFPSGAGCTTGATGACSVTIKASTTADTETIGASGAGARTTAVLTETAPTQAARSGYWLVGARGAVFNFGDAQSYGNAALGSANAVDIEGTPDGNGYWILDADGHVFTFGTAQYFGGMTLQSGERATSMSANPDGKGYWIFTDRGRVAGFGTSQVFGDMSGRALNGPVIGSVATPSGQGYYMVASDGGIFAFGDAVFRGSMGGTTLNAPVVGLVPDPDGVGYWLDAADGGVFAFEAGFRGSMGGQPLNKPIIGMVSYGNGYLMVASDGGVFDFSDKPFSGSLGSNPPADPIVNIAAQNR